MTVQKKSVASGPEKVWASLLTNINYLPGILTLHDSLQRAGTAYPFIALTSPSLPREAHAALASRGIRTLPVPHLAPTRTHDYGNDARFVDSWTKLAVFGLTQFRRVTLLDCDMLIRPGGCGIDRLMNTPLPGDMVFAASPACTCNPYGKPHYPPSWVPANCAYTPQHARPDAAQRLAPGRGPLGRLNSGTVVLEPSVAVYREILAMLEREETARMTFPDQDLLADLYPDRWVVLPYVFNALKSMRREGVHRHIWRDDEVRIVHYILSPKPWDEMDAHGRWTGEDETHKWWVDATLKRRADERVRGIYDGY
ncbi:glycosyl transferase family [Geosmithia morbida]|uniref:Glycosyl transferase family n=1 Tax=Geosmithia morbida TaxID=1094350 RepID=A0A9P5D582_9HYPO|nr:glycosyl transferase family [Geosmithia morbida]KAF4124291.1 glycosyl transferase family [Geosmithia morbida]